MNPGSLKLYPKSMYDGLLECGFSPQSYKVDSMSSISRVLLAGANCTRFSTNAVYLGYFSFMFSPISLPHL